MPTLLLTGAAGFLGRYIAEDCQRAGWTVHGLARQAIADDGSLSACTAMTLPDPGLPALVARLRPDVCVHCAGAANPVESVAEPEKDYRQGPAVVFDLLNALRLGAPECRTIFLSSAAVYGNPSRLPIHEDDPCAPISPYGFHKRQSEELLREFHVVYGLRTCSLRIFSAYGSGLQRQVVWDLMQKLSSGSAVTLRGTGGESRDFIHARDVASATRQVMDRARFQGEVYNLASGRETTISELADAIRAALGVAGSIEFDGQPAPAGTPLRWRADINRLRALGISPEISLEKGLPEVVQWFQKESLT